MKRDTPHSFAADATLGRLARWLRILGFDTAYQRIGSWEIWLDDMARSRIVLTRNTKLMQNVKDRRLIWIDHNDPLEQLRQTVRAVPIHSREIAPFTRCLDCNILLITIEKSHLHGKVPDYVWETQHEFTRCPVCERTFWPGSHRDAMLNRLSGILLVSARKE